MAIQSPFGVTLGQRAIWQVSYAKGPSVIEMGFGNREGVMKHVVLPLICCKAYWRAEGGTSLTCKRDPSHMEALLREESGRRFAEQDALIAGLYLR